MVTEIESSPCVLYASVVGESSWHALDVWVNRIYVFPLNAIELLRPNITLLLSAKSWF